MKKIHIVYKFTNTITGDFYIGSLKNVKIRCANHKYQPVWIAINDQVDHDIQKYGVDKFEFQVLAEVEEDKLEETEQEFIEKLHPTYNQMDAIDLNIERYKESHKSNKGKESQRKASNKYNNQLCSYNGQTLTLNALAQRFRRKGIPHPTIEAKKYIIKESETPIEFYDVYP